MTLPFISPDGRLKTYEILNWAVQQGPFILRDVIKQFRDLLSDKLDKDGQSLAEKDASERIRKLMKSGMIMVVTPSSLETLTKPYEAEVRRRNPESGKWKKAVVIVEPLLKKNQVDDYAQAIKALSTSSGRGRKPRVYLATRKGQEYVKFRTKRTTTGAGPGRVVR